MAMDVEFRPASEDDREVLWDLNRSGFGEVVAKQFGATEEDQRAHFDAHFAIAGVQLIFSSCDLIGYLHTESRGDHLYVVGIVLAPPFRQRGIGTQIMASILEEARRGGQDVRLQVLKANSATSFYEKLGFAIAGETDSHYQMVIKPQ